MKARDRLRVAICQPRIVLGGRLHVILAIAHALNEMGIVPDILTFGLEFDPADLSQNYRQPIQVRYKPVNPRSAKLPQDISIPFFNAVLNFYDRDYDLLINSSNSTIFFPERRRVLHYIHFPRERRLAAKTPDFHRPELELEHQPLSIENSLRGPLRQLYRLSKLHASHFFVCNSEYTRDSLREVYGDLPPINLVIYPPVDLSGRDAPLRNRAPSVVSVGRFSPAKRQLEQIMLAEQLPHIPFHIVGFVGDTMYFDRCLEYVKQNRLSNVHVHPNATREQMVALLEQSKYFLHTLVNEPFGITAVQAIATGCIPIVHDSGGQRETVPIEFLRYKELNEVPGILGYLELLDTGATSALVSDLLEHARQNFDASVFHHKIKGLLDSILGTI